MWPRATSSIESAITSRLTERGLHPLGAHRDAVGDRDGVELHRRAAGGADAVLHLLGEAPQVEVAGHRLGPGVRDADDRLGERLVVEADPVQVGARGGPVGALEDGAAPEPPAVGHEARAPADPVSPRSAAAAALPLGEPPEVAPDAAGVHLPARQVHVRELIRRRSSPVSAIHLASTSSEAGRREPEMAVADVGELDAVLAQQPAAGGHVGHDRLVRVDQVGVGGPRARSACRAPG